MSAAREALRRAIAERSQTGVRIEEAENALTKARSILAEAEVALAAAINARRRSTERAVGFRQWASGGQRPDADDPEAASRRAAFFEAEDRVQATKEAVAVLQAELDSVRAEHRRSQIGVATCVDTVISEEAEAVAVEFENAMAVVIGLRAKLSAIARLWTTPASGSGRAPAPITISRRVIDAINFTEHTYAPGRSPDNHAAASWHRFQQTLLNDPNAEPT
jgi:hypothetical protein